MEALLENLKCISLETVLNLQFEDISEFSIDDWGFCSLFLRKLQIGKNGIENIISFDIV